MGWHCTDVLPVRQVFERKLVVALPVLSVRKRVVEMPVWLGRRLAVEMPVWLGRRLAVEMPVWLGRKRVVSENLHWKQPAYRAVE
jgi:hypothetical protein